MPVTGGVRLNGIARGGSGASAAVTDTLAAMLNAGVHPVVPAIGSVGAPWHRRPLSVRKAEEASVSWPTWWPSS
jgi:hypothetical protein